MREARQRRGMTQDDVAEASGLDQTTISDLETGRNTNPRLDTIRRLAKALRIAPSRLKFSAPSATSTIRKGDDRKGHAASSPVGAR